jgi:hypothetical protein
MTEDNKEAMEGTAKYVNDLPAIVEQLERCGYQTADGLHNLSMNAAFIALKEIAAKSEGGEDETPLKNCCDDSRPRIICLAFNEVDDGDWMVKCYKCETDTKLMPSKQEAIESWNRRS